MALYWRVFNRIIIQAILSMAVASCWWTVKSQPSTATQWSTTFHTVAETPSKGSAFFTKKWYLPLSSIQFIIKLVLHLLDNTHEIDETELCHEWIQFHWFAFAVTGHSFNKAGIPLVIDRNLFRGRVTFRLWGNFFIPFEVQEKYHS